MFHEQEAEARIVRALRLGFAVLDRRRSLDRTTPYTEEELDLLVEGTLESIRDTASWKNLVDRAGKEEARRTLRSRIIMQDENARKLSRH